MIKEKDTELVDSDIQHPTSDIRHPTSNIRHPTSDIQHPTPDITESLILKKQNILNLENKLTMDPKNIAKLYKMSFAGVYPHYVTKVQKKGRTIEELHEVIFWLTGYNESQLQHHISNKTNFEQFFGEAQLHPNAVKITGMMCGDRIETMEDDLARKVRYLDKLVDELAKGRPMEKVLRK